MAPPARASVFWPILVLALLSTSTKAWVLLAPRPDMLGPGTIERPNVSVGEEYHRGNVAAELLDGPILAVIDYPYAPYLGGSLVLSAVASPLFAVFGRNLFALKLAPVLFQALAVIALVLLLDRYVSRRAAWLGGLMLALAPVGHTVISIQAWGSHCEASALALLATYAFLRAVEGGRERVWLHVLAGFAAGFCLWFDYATLPMLAGMWACALLVWRAVRPRIRVVAQALGLCVGLAPWVVYNLRHDFAGLRIYEAPVGAQLFAPASWFALPGRTWALFSQDVPFYLSFDASWPGVLGAVCVVLLVAATVAAVLALMRSGRLARSDAPASALPASLGLVRVAVFQVAFFVAAYLLQGYFVEARRPLSARYLAPLWPMLALAAPAVLATLVDASAHASRAFALAAVAWLAIGTTAWVSLCDTTRVGVLCGWHATDARALGRWIATRYGSEPHVVVEAVRAARRQRDAPFLREFEAGIRNTLVFLTDTTERLDALHVENRAAYQLTLAEVRELTRQ